MLAAISKKLLNQFCSSWCHIKGNLILQMVNSQNIKFYIIKIPLYKLLLENSMKYGFHQFSINFWQGYFL